MAEDEFEKTEPATPRRRQEARQEGNVARSTDLIAACTILAAVLLLYWLGVRLLGGMRMNVEMVLAGGDATNPTKPEDITQLSAFVTNNAVHALAPLLLCLFAITLLSSLGQVGLLLTGKPLAPNINKLNPIKGAQRMFSLRSGVRLGMSLLKFVLIAGVATWFIMQDVTRIAMIAQLEVLPMFGAACELVFWLAVKLAILLLLLGVADYAYQKWQHEQDLKMSKFEVKEEMKRMEGDPLVKQRRTRVARQLALQRIGQAVPQADVVVTNPTHFAVALKYDATTMRAPKVVAKGADYMAMRIRQLAIRHSIPLIERKELARGLYSSVEIGQEVPPEFYSAVAEILAYVYRLSGRRSA